MRLSISYNNILFTYPLKAALQLLELSVTLILTCLIGLVCRSPAVMRSDVCILYMQYAPCNGVIRT